MEKIKSKYSIIYADPPWFYNGGRTKNHKFNCGARGHYPVMSFEDIYKLPVQNITNENAALFLWCTFPRLKEGIQTIKSWGFEYKTGGFTWVKTNKNNNNPFFGVGYYTKSNAEICLLGIKGKMKPVSNKVSSVIVSPIQKHSEKPNEARTRIVKLFGDLPRIELFAREETMGWDCWGHESNGN